MGRSAATKMAGAVLAVVFALTCIVSPAGASVTGTNEVYYPSINTLCRLTLTADPDPNPPQTAFSLQADANCTSLMRFGTVDLAASNDDMPVDPYPLTQFCPLGGFPCGGEVFWTNVNSQ